jgi:lipopolysaccharide export system protein LptA
MRAAFRVALVAAAAGCAAFAIQVHAQQQPTAQAPSPASSGTLGLGGDDSGKPTNIEADNGVEWQQTNRVYIARGNAKATRGETSVTADTLYAYYRPAPSNPAAPATPAPKSDLGDGANQVYRIEADGNVVFVTPTQTAYGDHAVYDLDQALLVLTGKNLKIVTPEDVVTARDSLEWYDQKQLGVARGDALAVRQAPVQKSIRGDTLIAEISKPANQPSKISKVDAHGHVILTSPDEVAHGDSAVYNLDTGIATLAGNVSLTKGENELRGQYGIVDTNNNVSRLLSAPPSARLTGGAPARVEGLLVRPPHDQAGGAPPTPGNPKP